MTDKSRGTRPLSLMAKVAIKQMPASTYRWLSRLYWRYLASQESQSPACASPNQRAITKRVPWSLAAGVAACVGMGNTVLFMSVAQRVAVACFLVWLVVISCNLWRCTDRW